VVSVWIAPIAIQDSSAKIDEQQRAIEKLLNATSQLPQSNSNDGFSNRDHDQILYGKPA
jgi:hypothetical protein